MQSNFNKKDEAVFHSSFIPIHYAKQAGIYRVDSVTGAELIGRTPSARKDYAGLIYPNFLPEQTTPREYCLRLDNPEMEKKSDGVVKPKNKYLFPGNSKNMIYFGVDVTNADLQNPNLPKVFTEGQKKTLALQRMSKEGKNKFVAVGLSGVWGWRGRIGKTIDADRKRVDVKGIIPDFEFFNFQNCIVYICFDTNVKTNESVKAARKALARELTERGAIVFLVELPDIEGVNGVDDLLGKYEAEFDTQTAISKVWELFENAQEFAKKKASQKTILSQFVEHTELFHTEDGETFATVKINDHQETYKVRSKPFRDWLRFRFYLQENTVPSEQSLQEAIGVFDAMAQFEGDQKSVNIRFAETGGKIYFDLCNSTWQQVEIDKSGWRIIESKKSPVKFRRTKGMLAVPAPNTKGDISKLRKYINVDDAGYSLILGWLMACFRVNFAFPILIINGEQGSAKTTTCRVLRRLIDPNKADLRSAPRDERDLVIAANNGWIIALDNLSHIPDWLSDALCRVSTGGALATRTLYTDDEEQLFNVKRPILINGIDELANRSDLIDRSIIKKLLRILETQRKEESVFWSEFESDQAFILGGLLDIVVRGLNELENITLKELPRMADFAKWVVACEKEFPENAQNFIDQYLGNRSDANDLALESSPIGQVIQRMAEKFGPEGFKGTPTDFFENLEQFATDKEKSQKGFPKNSRSFGKQLARIIPNLRAKGIEISDFKDTDKGRQKRYKLEWIGYQTSETSETSADSIKAIETTTCPAEVLTGISKLQTSEKSQTSEQTSGVKALKTNTVSNLSDISDVSDVYLQSHSKSAVNHNSNSWEEV